jgi:ferredoxin
MPRVTVDPDQCVGTAECVRLAPEAFELDDTEDIASVTPGAATAPLAQLRRAAYECPTGAIDIDEDTPA